MGIVAWFAAPQSGQVRIVSVVIHRMLEPGGSAAVGLSRLVEALS